MHELLSAFADAASDPTSDALSCALSLWPQLTAEEQQAAVGIGKTLRACAAADPALSAALRALADVARAPSSLVLAEARELCAALPADAVAVVGPAGALLRDRVIAAEAADTDDETAAMLAAYGDMTGVDEDDDEDPGAYDAAPGTAGGYEPAGEDGSSAVAVMAPPTATAVGVQTDLTAEQLLERWGLPGFRPGQREAVQAALDGRDSLVVMPTGGGKSLCYQMPGTASDALTVVVSPLIALIADQHQRVMTAGHRSVMLASTLGEDAVRDALSQIRDGWAQIVFCAPERFASRSFRSALASRQIALFVVDEAHCVSEWGHDFRPDYLRLMPVIESLGRPPVMAATATATPKVAAEIVSRLGLRDPVMVRSGFDRPNLSFDVVALDGEGAVARKRGALMTGLADEANRPAVVYCGTRKDTESVASDLNAAGIAAVAYHAGMDTDRRQASQQAFMTGAADVVVATNAFGMGVDKADVRSVWHWALPSSVEAYYQEAGRAGRDGQPARAVLLAMRGDLGRLVKFIKDSEISVSDVEKLLGRLSAKATGNVVLVDPREQRDADRIAVAVAERAGALVRAAAGAGQEQITLTGPLDRSAAHRVCKEAVGRRWDAYKTLKTFAQSDGCRRRQLLDHFGDNAPGTPQGRCCDVCDPAGAVQVPAGAPARRRSSSPSSGPAASGPPVDQGQFDVLRSWRASRADGKPAYTVATNATLEEVLRHRPADTDALLSIKGIGPSFVTKHGESLLAELAAL